MTQQNPPQPSPSYFVCPTCGRRIRATETAHAPFCSERCQMIDLGRWLNEEVGLPFENEPDPTRDEMQ